MPESEEHSNLVTILYGYIADRFCEGQGKRILVDSVSSESPIRPPSIEGYVPDTYVMLNEQGRVVIGEAKSMRDLETSRSEAQIAAFLRRSGMTEDSVFILAVPWPIERLAGALLMKLLEREELLHVETVVLSDMNPLGTTTMSGGL